jgi:hypothetical protein
MGGPRKVRSSFSGSATPSPPPRAPAERPAAAPEPAQPSEFLDALAELLTSRGLDIPEGLLEAPPAAYASQGLGAVQMMTRMRDADVLERATKVASWQARQEERSVRAWEASPLIGEVRRRGLKEPARPDRVAAIAFSLKKPLAEWTDQELQEAVAEWAGMGSPGPR